MMIDHSTVYRSSWNLVLMKNGLQVEERFVRFPLIPGVFYKLLLWWDFRSPAYTIFILISLLLSCFSCVRLCATPEMAAHQAPPSLGFSRQEHWSGLPFPSPMCESEKWKEVAQSWPHGLQPTRLFHPWDFPGKTTGVGCHCLLHLELLLKYNLAWPA